MASPVESGQTARQQAIDAAYSDATSRLDPQWAQRESAQRAQLLAQGLDPTSSAGQSTLESLGQQRNDAYTRAMNSAISQGTEAGNAVFRNSLMARQVPMQELQALFGFTAQPTFPLAGRADAPNYLAAAGMQHGADVQAYERQQQQIRELMDMLTGILGTGANMMTGGVL